MSRSAAITAWTLAVTAATLGQELSAADWLLDQAAWRSGTHQGTACDATGRLSLAASADGKRQGGTFITDAIANPGDVPVRYLSWMGRESRQARIAVAWRPVDGGPGDQPWTEVSNPSLAVLGPCRRFQLRIELESIDGRSLPAVTELLLSSDTPATRFAGLDRPRVEDLRMTMMYESTPEKLHALYGSGLPFDAAERGLYILRQRADQPIGADHVVRPKPEEMHLPMRHGTRIVMRIHPVAPFSPLGLTPQPVVMRHKAGAERPAAIAAHKAVNFFDRSFMAEYEHGIRAAVRYNKAANPAVVGYTVMPPEFFYDTEGWPQMDHLGGFGPAAFADYRSFMADLGIAVSDWPAPSDGDVARTRDHDLWAFWRTWAGHQAISRMARAIKEEDPQAQVGTMHYVGAQSVRGLEAGLVERDPAIDFYYSANIYPRIPGPDGFSGGTTISRSRLNCLGQPRKASLAEFDLWSPYVDLAHAGAYADYANLQRTTLVPIIFGEFPTGNRPSNHLTKYHGMQGSPVTPDLLRQLAGLAAANRHLRQEPEETRVAVILPSFSLFSILDQGRWNPHRYQQRMLTVLQSLQRIGASVDLLTEGHADRRTLDRYRLAILIQPAVFPQLRHALQTTTAHVAAFGWAATIATPGPLAIEAPVRPEHYDLGRASAWPRDDAPAVPSGVLPTGGTVAERTTTITFTGNGHPLLRGLDGMRLDYQGIGLGGRPLPYVAGLRGVPLAVDGDGAPVFALATAGAHEVIHFGPLLAYTDARGQERTLLPEAGERQLLANILDRYGIPHCPDLAPALAVTTTGRSLLLENTSAVPYAGPVPRLVHDPRTTEAETVEIPPGGMRILPWRTAPR